MQLLFYVLFAINYLTLTSAARLAGECAMMCNDLRTEVLTLEMCRNAKRTLPRPKVGDFCSTAMEQGFSDACVAICMEQRPQHRVAQTCRAAAIEMPRPTVRKWCEHGYNVAFEKTIQDLANHWRNSDAVNEPVLEAVQSEPEQHVHHGEAVEEQQQERRTEEAVQEQQHREHIPERASGLRGGAQAEESHTPSEPQGAILATIPITLDDATHNLVVHEGQNAEEAVVIFCREHSADDVSTCIRQLLSVVIEKLDEIGH